MSAAGAAIVDLRQRLAPLIRASSPASAGTLCPSQMSVHVETEAPGTLMIPLRPQLILRLRKGNRHVIALLLADGTLTPAPFWSEAQAASACDLAFNQWSSLPTEVFSEIHLDGIQPEISIFARATRRGRVERLILWTKDGIFPRILATVADAVEAIESEFLNAKRNPASRRHDRDLCDGTVSV